MATDAQRIRRLEFVLRNALPTLLRIRKAHDAAPSSMQVKDATSYPPFVDEFYVQIDDLREEITNTLNE